MGCCKKGPLREENQDKVSGTTAATSDHQMILIRMIARLFDLKLSDLPFGEYKLSVEVNERFVINDDYSYLPINVDVPSLAISENCKELIFIDTVLFLMTG